MSSRLTTEEAANLIGRSEQWLRREVAEGRVAAEAERLGTSRTRLRFDSAEVDRVRSRLTPTPTGRSQPPASAEPSLRLVRPEPVPPGEMKRDPAPPVQAPDATELMLMKISEFEGRVALLEGQIAKLKMQKASLAGLVQRALDDLKAD